MSIQHHPSDDTLARHCAGTLAAGPALVVATHLSFCPACRRLARGFTSLQGDMLCDAEPVPLTHISLAMTLARLNDAPTPPPHRPLRNPDLPAPLTHVPLGKWRWLAPGIRMARIGPREKDRSLFLLRCAPGSSLPEHSHLAPEYSCVIKGSYADAAGRYSVGDMEETQSDLSHAPRVDRDGGECIAVIAVEGHLQLQGFLPRLFQPLFGL